MRRALATCVALAWPAIAGAQATFTSQQRFVRATTESEALLWEQGTNPAAPDFDPPTATHAADDVEEIQAPDLGSFAEGASSEAPPAVGTFGAGGVAWTSQHASLTPQLLTATGEFYASAAAKFADAAELAALNALLQPPLPYVVALGQGTATGRSDFEVEFTLSAPTPFHLFGTVTHMPASIGQVPPLRVATASIELTGPAGGVASVSLTPVGRTETLDAEGTLAPGTYTLRAEAIGSEFGRCIDFWCSFGSAFTGSYDVRLSLTPVPGPSRGALSLLGVALASIGFAALRRS